MGSFWKNAKRVIRRRPGRTRGSASAWGWWFSADEETYSGPHATRDDAVHAGFGDRCGEDYHVDGMGCFHVIEARQGPILLGQFINADDFLQPIMEAIDDEHGGEDGIQWDRCWTDAQHAQLGRWIGRVIAFWQWWNRIEVRTYLFTHTRNAEWYTWHRRFPPAG